MEIKNFVHEHPLTLCEKNNNGQLLCHGCGSHFFGESYSCTNCGFNPKTCSACNNEVTLGSFYICEMCWPQSPLFHQSCVDLPEEICITHYRPQCVLHFERESSDESNELDCDFCQQRHSTFKYCCWDCDFQIGVGCASMFIKYHQGQQHVEHCSHHHPLTSMKLHDIDMNCKLCSKSIIGRGYGCAPCEFYIHNSCRDEFPQEIRHPFHPSHSLTVLADGKRNRYICDACGIFCQGLRYRCDMCDFDLHLECSSLKPNMEYKGHQHLLILIENLKYNSICEACGFRIRGVFFARCVRCDLNFHVQCGSGGLPPSVLHKDHKHPLFHNNEALTSKDDSQLHFCNVCGKESNPEDPFYCCVECEYFAHVRCAITEIPYDDKGKLRHFGHEHILILSEIHKNDDGTFCYGCRKAIQGPTYGCDHCKFYLHKSCVKLPREIHHQSHEHYLTLETFELLSEQSTCHACGKHFDGFIYHCGTCEFDLDIDCASEHPAVNLMVYTDKCESHEGQERIGHFSHEHHLNIISKSEVTNLKCKFCYKNIDGRCYGCVGCEFYIHISCGELPTEVRHPFHQLHPLTLLVAEKFMYRCDACRFEIQGFRYRCDMCDFDLHPDCLSLKANIKYKGHEHLLTLIENMSYDGECEACGLSTDGAFFMRCIECKLNFHVRCGLHPLPPTAMAIQHGHHLTLITRTLAEDNSDQSYCTVCNTEINPEHPIYCCADCEYYAHVGCVITEVQVDERQKTTKHFSHEHLLFLYENKKDIFCDGCLNDIQANAPAYGCDQCRYYLHKSCAELPRQRQHPFHRHPLFLEDNVGECSACRKYVYSFCYLCKDCDFILDLDCSSLLPSIKLESVHDKHTLTFFEKLYGTPKCSHCKSYNLPPDELTPLDLSYICCVKCKLNWHLLCFPMPQTIDHHSHLHSLTLKDKCVELSSHCFDDKYYCDFCETIRDGRECVYHCENCNFVVDLECVFSEVMQFLEGKSKDVEGRSVGKSGLTYSYKYIFENLTPEEKKEMESTREGIFQEPEKTLEGTHEDIFKELKEIDHDRISKKLPSYAKGLLKCVAKEHVQGLLQLGYIDKDAELELVNVGDYKMNPNLAPVLNKLLDKHGDIGASCPLTPKLKTIALITLCAIMEIMNSSKVRNLDVASIIMWWFLLKLVQRAGFKIDFALDQLKRIARELFSKR